MLHSSVKLKVPCKKVLLFTMDKKEKKKHNYQRMLAILKITPKPSIFPPHILIIY